MNLRPSQLAAFHLIGERPGCESGTTKRNGLRPALFSAYRDLSKVRYDYPLVLLSQPTDGDHVKSLKDITNNILREIAPSGAEGEEVRRQVLRLEQQIRDQVAGGGGGSLSRLFDDARRTMITGTDMDARETLTAKLLKARAALGCDGEVVNCDLALPSRLMRHAWAASQQAKAHRLAARIDGLAQKLRDILRVDFMQSKKARDARHLKGSMGSAEQTVIDFKAMASILRSAPTGDPLPRNRERRISAAIAVLESQQFVATANGRGGKLADNDLFVSVFDRCDQALAAFQERLPLMAELVRAISIAELEIDNRYDECRHVAFFERFDEALLRPEDLALFPSSLVCLVGGVSSASEQAALLKLLGAGLPIKIMAQSDDILAELPVGSGQLSFGTRVQQIANTAVGLNSVFVMQSAVSSLYRLRHHVLAGLANDGPALFSIYSGCGGGPHLAAPYLVAAAATEARAFPCFVYDPNAGQEPTSRFSLDNNPQAEADWPAHVLQYEDSDHARLADGTAFTFVDFVACDARYAEYFACVPRSDWHDGMLPTATFLEEEDTLGPNGTATIVPYVPLIDETDTLHRAIVDDRLISGARRCRDLWRDLQYRGGLKDTGAEAALEEARAEWEKEKQQLLAAAGTPSPPLPDGAAYAAEPATDTVPPVAEAPIVSPNEPFIETPRCTTCNECTELNSQMFAYNDDMQAYIQDADAGTYRQLVEAAEVCQVCIIHPGLPRNQSESGLDELLERAAPFNGS